MFQLIFVWTKHWHVSGRTNIGHTAKLLTDSHLVHIRSQWPQPSGLGYMAHSLPGNHQETNQDELVLKHVFIVFGYWLTKVIKHGSSDSSNVHQWSLLLRLFSTIHSDACGVSSEYDLALPADDNGVPKSEDRLGFRELDVNVGCVSVFRWNQIRASINPCIDPVWYTILIDIMYPFSCCHCHVSHACDGDEDDTVCGGYNATLCTPASHHQT